MTKRRVSVKGKGADIFFGDLGGTQPPTPATAEDTAATPTVVAARASKNTRMQASKLTSVQAAQSEAPQETASSSPTATPPSTLRALLNAVWQPVAERATITNAFRYTDQDLALLEDAIYDIHKKHKVKLTKQEIARLGLNAVLWDYQLNGEASLLGEFVQRRKRWLEGEQ